MNDQQHYQRGMAAFVARRYAEAISYLEIAAGPAEGEARIARFYLGQAHDRWGRVLLREGAYRDAAAHLIAASRMTPQGGDLPAYLAQCYLRERQFDVAAQELERLISRNPDATDTRVRLALAQYKSGEAWRAITTLREGLERCSQTAELHYQLGVLMASMDDTLQAQVYFEDAVALDPSHARAYERLAQCCSVDGRHVRAIRYLERAHQLDPNNPRVLWQLAIAGEQGMSVSAPTEPTTHYDAAALDRLADAVLSDPEFIETFLSLPVSAVDQDVFRALAVTMERALASHPEYADLHYHCGRVYRRLGAAQNAIEHAERAVEINPRYVNSLILLAELYSQTDRAAEGVPRLEAAIRAGGDYPDVHYLMGRLSLNVGQAARAKEAFARALELNADYREAREALAALAC